MWGRVSLCIPRHPLSLLHPPLTYPQTVAYTLFYNLRAFHSLEAMLGLGAGEFTFPYYGSLHLPAADRQKLPPPRRSTSEERVEWQVSGR